MRVLENIPETPSISGHEFLRWQRNQDAPLLRTVIGFRMQTDMQSQKERRCWCDMERELNGDRAGLGSPGTDEFPL